MKWVMIAVLWNTPVPQESMKFVTKTFSSQEACQDNIQELYAAAFNNGVQGQAICVSESQLKLIRPNS